MHEDGRVNPLEFLTYIVNNHPSTQPFVERYGSKNLIYALLGLAPFCPASIESPEEAMRQMPSFKRHQLFFIEDGGIVTATFDFQAFRIFTLGDYLDEEMAEEDALALFEAFKDTKILERVYQLANPPSLTNGSDAILIFDDSSNSYQINKDIRSSPQSVIDTKRAAITPKMSAMLNNILDMLDEQAS